MHFDLQKAITTNDGYAATMVNEFLTQCHHHHSISFCLNCRQQKVFDLRQQGLTRGQLQTLFLSDIEEHHRLNHLFAETLNRVIRGESFRQECLNGTQYTSFGWWMRNQPQYDHLSKSDRTRLRKQVNYAHKVYTDWDIITENLTDEDVMHIDPRKLSLEQLYKARNAEWCIDYDEFIRTPGDVPEVLLYSEDKYKAIIRFILESGIINDVQNDRKQVSMLGRRIQRDIKKIRNILINNNDE